MALSLLQNLVGKLTRAIDKAATARDISADGRRDLYKALFFLLAGDPNIQVSLQTFCKRAKRSKALSDLVKVVGRKVKLPQVLHANTTKNVSLNNAKSIWKVPSSDIKLIQKIATIAEVDSQAEQHLLRSYYSSVELHWLAEVEKELEEVEVIINREALEDMLMGVFETYKVPKSKKEPYSEVFGLCLGMTSRQKFTKKGKGTRTKWFVNVDRAVPQIRARASSNSVTPNTKSIEAVVETANSLFPQLEIIGDYHSHPYRDMKMLKEAKGWEASQPDIADIYWMYRDLREHPKRQHRMRVSFIIAIAKGRSSANTNAHMRGLPSVYRMNIAGCNVFISAYRILSNGIMTNAGVTLVKDTGQRYFEAG